jgi:hypothetical protein
MRDTRSGTPMVAPGMWVIWRGNPVGVMGQWGDGLRQTVVVCEDLNVTPVLQQVSPVD